MSFLNNELETTTTLKADQIRLILSYHKDQNNFLLQFHFQECELFFSTPIKFKNGSTLLSIAFTHKSESNNPSLISNLRLIEKFDQKSTIGFDLSSLDCLQSFHWKKHLNGFLGGYYGVELNILSPTKKILIILGYQDNYLADFPYREGDTLKTYTERYKKLKKRRQ